MITELEPQMAAQPERALPQWQTNLIAAKGIVSSLIEGGEGGLSNVVDGAVQSGVDELDAKTALSWLAMDGKIEIGWDGNLRLIPEDEQVVWIDPDADW